MNRTNNFFEKNQSYLTAAKINIYEEYINGYIPKLLMTFNSCIMIDMFCGPGMNWDKLGSPLVLIKTANKIVNGPSFQNKENLKLQVLFNDQLEENKKNLDKEISKIRFNRRIINVYTKNEKYEDYIKIFIAKNQDNKTPKFIFLDPFTYSNVKVEELKQLMDLPNTEVLLFIPIFHSYRFASKEFEKEHKTRKFIEEYTTKGVYNYKNIIEFTNSVKEKLKSSLKIDYVRPVLLDGGGSKNSLFLMTKHEKGMLLMNKVVFKTSDDGFRLKISSMMQEQLFNSDNYSSLIDDFENHLILMLKKNSLTNAQIVHETIKEGLLPKHTKNILKKLHNKNLIKVIDSKNQEVNNRLKWNIAESINAVNSFKWIKKA